MTVDKKNDHHIVGAKEKLAHAHDIATHQQPSRQAPSGNLFSGRTLFSGAGAPFSGQVKNPKAALLFMIPAFLASLYFFVSLLVSHAALQQVEGRILDNDGSLITIAYPVQGRFFKIIEPLPTGRHSYTARQSLKTGTLVPVLYDPKAPQKAQRNTHDWLYLAAIVVVLGSSIAGIVFSEGAAAIMAYRQLLMALIAVTGFILGMISIWNSYHSGPFR